MAVVDDPDGYRVEIPEAEVSWKSYGAVMQLDDLDERLLAHFSARFPKPGMLEFCEYDVDLSEVTQLCQHPRPFEVEGLIGTFVGHNRLILAENILRSEKTRSPSELVKALKDFLTENGEADEGKIRRHLGGMANGHDNQVLPGTDFVDRSSVASVNETIKNYDGLIAIHG